MASLFSNEMVLLGSVFGAIMFAAIGILGLIRRDPASRRLQGATGSGEADTEKVSIFHKDTRSSTMRMLEPFQRAVAQTDAKQVGVARARLIEAGYYRPSALDIYFTVRVIMGIALPIVVGLGVFFFAPQITGTRALLFVLFSAALGFYMPALFIASKIDERQKAFQLGMPDALDMILVGVEAGLSLPAALKHICSEFEHSHPVVAEQFQIVILEFQSGKSRADALYGLSRRMDVQETRTFSSMIVQSEALGTSMAQTLRVMADEMRIKRMLKAEKTAAELPVKMSVPLVLCIFPALMAVALVPAIINILKFFSENVGS